MTKLYRPWNPEQSYLLPPSPLEWLPEGHLARFMLDVVRELDLGEIEGAVQAKDGRGERPYAPRMMTALILYGYCTGVFSSRGIERATYDDVAFRVLSGGVHPHFTTVNTFRLEHREALGRLFLQVLKLCAHAGLKTVGHVSLDGSKVQANASKHKAMSYGRMKEEEKRLEGEIEALLRRADEVDAQEDDEFGRDKRGDELPEELQRRETRLAKIREAKAALEKEAAESRAARLRANAEEMREKLAQDAHLSSRTRNELRTKSANAEKKAEKLAPRNDDDDDGAGSGTQLSLHRVQATTTAAPEEKAQRNFTDGDSRIMIRSGGFLQAYNVQAVVSEDQVIVGHGLTNDPTDAAHLEPMLERVRENCGAVPATLTADSGYLSEANITYCEQNAIDAYIAGTAFDAKRSNFPPTTKSEAARFMMKIKLASPLGRETYARRKVIAEPVFGQIKGAMGFRRFSLRSLLKVPHEWAIVCACHNLLKLFRRRTALAIA